MISDNALIAFECMDTIQKSSDRKGKFCAYKLDLSKAYDRVDWTFLEGAMKRMGFDEQWIKWIMACVTSVRYAVRFNGALLEPFMPTRGLRQGDPLSPYLFLLVGEGLPTLIQTEINNQALKELKICRRAPGISHLLFADDSLLFFEANADQATKVSNVLKTFERCTGQLLSPNKCSILLGNKVSEGDGKDTMNILKVEKESFEEKYLGLPVPEGRMKDGHFEPIKERCHKKCNDWCEKYMSSGAKEALIKSVVQAMPNHAMSVFKFSVSLCDDLAQIIRNFWWGDETDKKKTHWKAWEKIAVPKHFGGMGFKDPRLFNQALLARKAWRLIKYPDSLCARFLKARYYPNGELTDTAFSKNPSPGWQVATAPPPTTSAPPAANSPTATASVPEKAEYSCCLSPPPIRNANHSQGSPRRRSATATPELPPPPHIRYHDALQRDWGTWVSYITDRNTTRRIWLGTFQSAAHTTWKHEVQNARLNDNDRGGLNFPLGCEEPVPKFFAPPSRFRAAALAREDREAWNAWRPTAPTRSTWTISGGSTPNAWRGRRRRTPCTRGAAEEGAPATFDDFDD
ncbi:hypothetical protein QYE76_039785 [Lolium multiflorum]|uniref:Reverse transcriptase domain-containing protein n=1 Tax=Lolium multiflorum TaxID=4521 RepID=A0AAD8TBS9_LOLMU|nr:hypothetical protein QYE76_039785 [Lolium multiflorum]